MIQLNIYKVCYNSQTTNNIWTDARHSGTIQKKSNGVVRTADLPTRQQRSHEQHPSQGA